MDQQVMQDQLLESFKQSKSSSNRQNRDSDPPKMADICLVCNLSELFNKYSQQPEVVVDVVEETVLEPREVRQALEKMSSQGALDVAGLHLQLVQQKN